jgi:hypothetical protein
MKHRAARHAIIRCWQCPTAAASLENLVRQRLQQHGGHRWFVSGFSWLWLILSCCFLPYDEWWQSDKLIPSFFIFLRRLVRNGRTYVYKPVKLPLHSDVGLINDVRTVVSLYRLFFWCGIAESCFFAVGELGWADALRRPNERPAWARERSEALNWPDETFLRWHCL